MKYKLSTIKWFKIYDSNFLPFIPNNDNTKIKLLIENVVLPLKPVYSDDRISLTQVRNGTSFESQCMYAVEDYLQTERVFVVSNPEYIFINYYLDKNIFQRLSVILKSNEDNELVIKSKIYNELWLSEPQIKRLTEEVNKNYQKNVKHINAKAQKEDKKREKAREKAKRDREKTEEKISETKNF